MDLLSADRELTRNSYYAATAERQHSHPPLQGAQGCDVAVVGGGLAGLSAALELARARLLGHAARSTRTRLGRQRAQRRPGDPWPGLRPVHDRSPTRPGRGPARLGHVDRGPGSAAAAHRPPRHRLRLARRLPGPGHQCTQGPRTAGLGRAHGAGLWLRAAAHSAGADGPMDRQRAFPQRRVRCALGPPASAEVHAGPGACSRGCGRDAA